MVFRNVQALRAVAALLVVAVHMGTPAGFETRYLSPTPSLMHVFDTLGGYGVDLFFVISGFIMTVTSWKLFGSTKQSRTFLLRRIARIYPPYWAALLPLLVVRMVRPDLINSHATVAPDILSSFLLLPQRGDPLLLVSWTLVFEMAFYLVFALALRFERRLLPAVLLAWAALIAVASLLWTTSANPYLRFLSNPLPIEFFFGIAAGALVMRGTLTRATLSLCAGLAIVGTLMTAATIHGNLDYPSQWGRSLFAGSGFAAILYGAVVLEKARGLLLPRWLDALGDASYAMYLWHIPVLTALGLAVVHLHARSVAAHVVLLALAFVAVSVVALVVYRFIERPLMRAVQNVVRGRAEQRRPAPSASEAGPATAVPYAVRSRF